MSDAAIADRASITGRCIAVGPEFVVMEVQNEEVWIPRGNVLVIHSRER